MELSIFLAKAWGLFIVVQYLGVLMNIKQQKMILSKIENNLTLQMSGVIALGIGIAQVLGHNIWVFNWIGLITLLGWISFIKGLMILIVPGYMVKSGKKFSEGNWHTLTMVIVFILGIYLLYAGFTH